MKKITRTIKDGVLRIKEDGKLAVTAHVTKEIDYDGDFVYFYSLGREGRQAIYVDLESLRDFISSLASK